MTVFVLGITCLCVGTVRIVLWVESREDCRWMPTLPSHPRHRGCLHPAAQASSSTFSAIRGSGATMTTMGENVGRLHVKFSAHLEDGRTLWLEPGYWYIDVMRASPFLLLRRPPRDSISYRMISLVFLNSVKYKLHFIEAYDGAGTQYGSHWNPCKLGMISPLPTDEETEVHRSWMAFAQGAQPVSS